MKKRLIFVVSLVGMLAYMLAGCGLLSENAAADDPTAATDVPTTPPEPTEPADVGQADVTTPTDATDATEPPADATESPADATDATTPTDATDATEPPADATDATEPPADGTDTVAPTAPPADEPVSADNGKTITMARATWDTGWFQAEIFKQLLQQLGYTVTGPEKLSAADFYQAAARGDVDMWPNGWFPTHNSFMEAEGVQGRVEAIGSEVRGGALQGYLVDAETAERLDITSLEDFKDPDIIQAFDTDGNGKANLIGCNTGWGCELIIEHHLDAYDLRDVVEHVQGDYDVLMSETVGRYNNGEPIFFYTWTPNWTLGKLMPGQDVVWIEVPFSSLPQDQKDKEELTVVPDVPGCVANPCNMGFPPNDIRVAANSDFLREHPQAMRLFELVEIPLLDIAAQNSRMFDGENSEADIQRHAQEWIAQNQAQVDQWLAEASAMTEVVAESSMLQRVRDRGVLRCGVDGTLPGFSYQEADGTFSGFNADFCRVVAAAVFGDAEAVEFVPLAVKERFAAVSDRKVDVLFHNTTWTAMRDVGMDPPNSGISLDFGPTLFHDGQGFMVHRDGEITSIEQLEGRKICVLKDSAEEQVLVDQFDARNISFELTTFDDVELVYEIYEAGVCDAVTESVSQLASRRVGLQDPDTHVILGQKISREPQGPAFIEGDSEWANVVSWSVFATIYAEELGVNINNIMVLQNSEDPDIMRLLGKRGTIGEKMGVANNFAQNILEQVGNYEDIYNRNLGPATELHLDRGPNKAWNRGEGGVLSSPPFR
jgi:glycine betaine/proline transport system substrate-binding protein